MIRLLLLGMLLLSIVGMQECGQATSNGANGNSLVNANGNTNVMVENANASNGPTTNPPSSNAGGTTGGAANNPAGGPPSGGNPPPSNR